MATGSDGATGPLAALAFLLAALVLSASGARLAEAAPREFNYDEAKVPAYELPDPLVMQSGERVEDAEAWHARRRPEILELFRAHMYGREPARPEKLAFKVFDVDGRALGGTATRKQVAVLFTGAESGPRMDLLVYLPAGVKGPVPVFLGLNFFGNHTVNPDPAIRLPAGWVPGEKGAADNRAAEAGRGSTRSRWPVEDMLARGYGLATAYCGDIDPDHHDGFRNGVHGAFDAPPAGERAADAWGTVSAWAWGLSRALDCLGTDADVDARRVAVIGHSRLGKTALWAGASDERFALVISNDSGCGGAALSRRRFGETVARINDVFPHWFCSDFRRFGGREDDLPFDQHMLLALVAPRPVYVASAVEDRWADPRGEFLSALHADPVYRLLGTDGLAARLMPEPGLQVPSTIGYHIRPGPHDITGLDWRLYMDFADRHLGRR